MPTIEEIANAAPPGETAPAAGSETAAPETPSAPAINWLEVLTRPTGPGELADYMTGHPLNPWGNQNWARVLRGLSGLMKLDLKLAVVDIIGGLAGFLMKPKVATPNG